MLQIKINGHIVDLSKDIAFEFTLENPIFESERIPVPFTTTIDLPLSIRNTRIFNFPQRINSNYVTVKYTCEIVFDGLVIQTGKFVIQEVTDVVSGYFQAAEITTTITQAMDRTNTDVYQVATTSGSDYIYSPATDATIFINDRNFQNAYSELNDLLNDNGADNDSPFVIAPIRLSNESFMNGKKVAFQNIRTMFLNPLLFKSNSHNMWDAFRNFYKQNDYDLDGYYVMGGIIPAIRLGYLFDKIFGMTLKDNVFKTGELKKVVLQSLYHPTMKDGEVSHVMLEKGLSLANGSTPRYFNLAKFLSIKKCNDLVKEVLKIFCASIYTENGSFLLKLNKDIIADQDPIDLSQYPCRVTSISKEDGKAYQYGYSESSDDHDIPKTTWDVANFSNIFLTGDSGVDEIFYVKNTNQYIKRTFSDQYTQKWTYQVLANGFGESPNEESDDSDHFDSTSSLTPLSNSIHNIWSGKEMWDDNPNFARPYPWPRDSVMNTEYESIYIPETSSVGNADEFPKIMLYQGQRTGLAKSWLYPLLTAKNYDAKGARLGDLSLDWEGDDGLLERFHKEFAKWIGAEKMVIQVEMLLPPHIAKNLPLYKKYYFMSKMFYIKKAILPFTADKLGLATLEMVEA